MSRTPEQQEGPRHRTPTGFSIAVGHALVITDQNFGGHADALALEQWVKLVRRDTAAVAAANRKDGGR